MRPEDVPKVPSDDYMNEEEKRKKTAPIEAHFGPWTPDKKVDDRMKDFPSLSNKIAQLEAAAAAARTQTVEIGDPAHTFSPADNGTTVHLEDLHVTSTPDMRLFLIDTYKDMASKCWEIGLSVGAVCRKLQELDTLLNTLGA